MALLPDRPLPISQVLDTAFNLYSSTLKAVLPLSIGANVLGMIVGMMMVLALGNMDFSNLDISTGLIVLLMMVGLAITLVSMGFYSAIIYLQGMHGRGQEVTAWPAMWFGFGRCFSVFFGYILFAIVVIIGLVLFIVPGFFLMVMLSMFIYAIVLERASIATSFTRSWQLVSGNWWRSLVILSVPVMVYFVAAMVVGVIAAILVGGLAFTGREVEDFMVGVELLNQLLSAVIGALLVPLVFATGVALFNDLILRREGGDLEQRIDAL